MTCNCNIQVGLVSWASWANHPRWAVHFLESKISSGVTWRPNRQESNEIEPQRISGWKTWGAQKLMGSYEHDEHRLAWLVPWNYIAMYPRCIQATNISGSVLWCMVSKIVCPWECPTLPNSFGHPGRQWPIVHVSGEVGVLTDGPQHSKSLRQMPYPPLGRSKLRLFECRELASASDLQVVPNEMGQKTSPAHLSTDYTNASPKHLMRHLMKHSIPWPHETTNALETSQALQPPPRQCGSGLRSGFSPTGQYWRQVAEDMARSECQASSLHKLDSLPIFLM